MTGLRVQSIAARLVTLHVLAIIAASICLPLVLQLLLSSAAGELQQRALREQAREVARHLRRDGDDRWRLDLPLAAQAQYVRGLGRYAYTVVDAEGRTLLTSRDDEVAIGARDTLRPTAHFFQQHRGQVKLAAISLPVDAEGQRVWVQAAQDMAHRDALVDDIVNGFLPKVGWVTVPTLALLLMVDLWIFRRALRPLMDASRMATRIGPTATEIRLPTRDMPREVLPLITAVNQALDRLALGFRAQREFTADAAHELRTPLAILRTHVDLMRDQSVAATLRQDIETMSRLVDQMLDIAELDTLVIEQAERADLHAVCADVASFLAPLAVKQGREIAVTGAGGPIWVHGNSEALFHAVRNLAENALRHTRPGSAVELEVTAEGAVRVLDSGPGVPESERGLIFQRFWRRHRRHDGNAGLGLSIVARIAAAHGGTVSVANRPQGGAAFTLDLSGGARQLEPAN